MLKDLVSDYGPVLLDQIIASGDLTDVVLGYVALVAIIGTVYVVLINCKSSTMRRRY